MFDKSIRTIDIDLCVAHGIGLDTAIVYSALHYLQGDSEDFFSATFDDLQIFTTLSKPKISKAIEILEEENLIETKSKGMPRRLHVKLLKDNQSLMKISEIINNGEDKISSLIDERIKKIEEYYM